MPYAELHARTYFTFLDGGSSPKELLERARELGLATLAITDGNGLHGVVEARDALLDLCDLSGREQEPQTSPRLLYGSELSFDQDVAVALARTRDGYARLSEAITIGRRAVEKGEFLLAWEQLAAHAEGLTLLAGGPRSEAMRLLSEGAVREAEASLSRLREAFGEHLAIELVRHLAPGDLDRSVEMARLAKRLGIPVVATNDVHFHERGRKRLHDVLRCIHEGCTLHEAGRRLLPNGEAHLKGPKEIAALFHDLPEAIEHTQAIADAISFRLCDIHYRPPAPELPRGETADSWLARLSREGLRRRLGDLTFRYTAQLEKELRIIAELGYAGYFLIMWDVVNVCREKQILCQGRGSAANSLVCYALEITSVRPDVIDMLFERFLSRERNEPPDIDLDIEHERREEIIQYVYRKYGRDHAGMVAEVIRYRRRSAVGEVGKALGFAEDQLRRLTKFMGYWDSTIDPKAFAAAGLDPKNPMFKLLFDCAAQIENFPRHLSIHVGGFILSEEPLIRSVPIENGRMADRTVIQWNKDDVDSMGMFKLDLLGLGMLTVLSKTFALVRAHRGVELTLQTVPPDDPETYAMLQKADSVGVFQVESRAQMSMLPRLKPKKFYDLVIEVAIVRPGPIQGQMVHPYLRRSQGMEPVEFPHPKLEKILNRTLGVPLFQEQVMRLAVEVGGYTPGEADQLRRDMASWRAAGRMERHRERLLANMRANGLDEEFAQRVYKQLEGFGAYGFPESHAAAFAYLAYASAYLKRHFPAEFACGLLNSQPMGFYSPAVIVNDAKRHGVEIRPIDVQRSDWPSTIEDGALRIGLDMVRGLAEEQGQAIVTARRARTFSSSEDLAGRAGLQQRAMTMLAAAGALGSLLDRRHAIWKATAQSPGPLFDGVPLLEPEAELPPLDPLEELRLDVMYGNAFPGAHPIEHLRAEMERRGILRACDIHTAEIGRQIRVAGLVITRQRPDAGGFVFVTLEDETGHADVAVSPGAFLRFQDVIRMSPALIVRGKLVGTGDARNIAGTHFAPLTVEQADADLPAAHSHDFH
jgi:error-prone DNA polymerase